MCLYVENYIRKIFLALEQKWTHIRTFEEIRASDCGWKNPNKISRNLRCQHYYAYERRRDFATLIIRTPSRTDVQCPQRGRYRVNFNCSNSYLTIASCIVSSRPISRESVGNVGVYSLYSTNENCQTNWTLSVQHILVSQGGCQEFSSVDLGTIMYTDANVG